MLAHLHLKMLPFSLINTLKTASSQTGVRIECLAQAALIQGLLEAPHGHGKEECHASASDPARPCHVLAPSGCPDSGVTEVPRPVMVQDEEPDLSL